MAGCVGGSHVDDLKEQKPVLEDLDTTRVAAEQERGIPSGGLPQERSNKKQSTYLNVESVYYGRRFHTGSIMTTWSGQGVSGGGFGWGATLKPRGSSHRAGCRASGCRSKGWRAGLWLPRCAPKPCRPEPGKRDRRSLERGRLPTIARRKITKINMGLTILAKNTKTVILKTKLDGAECRIAKTTRGAGRC